MLQIEILEDEREKEWDSFISSYWRDNPASADTQMATQIGLPIVHHAWSWKWKGIIANSFGHKPYYLAACDGGSAIVGILPLFHVRSILFGDALVSVPYLNAGGILARDEEVSAAILARAHELAQNCKARYIELRSRMPYQGQWCSLPYRSHKVAMTLPLTASDEDMFKAFSSKLRSQIRRPTKSGVDVRVYSVGEEDKKAFHDFYFVFSRNMRDLGTPVYPTQFIQSALHSFRSSAKIIIAYYEKAPVAAGITIASSSISGDLSQSVVEIPWASSLRDFNRFSPNMLVYWEAIKRACVEGHRAFDFGRSSPDSGTYKFKEQWGAKPIPLHWYYDMLSGDIPDVNPHNPKYSLLVSTWRKLPIPLANFIGPHLTKGLP